MVVQHGGHHRKPGGRAQRPSAHGRATWAELSLEPSHLPCEGPPRCEALSARQAQREDAALLSRGSKNHATGRCRPCRVFFTGDGCREGGQCNFCHYRHTEAKLQEMEVFSAKARDRRMEAAGVVQPLSSDEARAPQDVRGYICEGAAGHASEADSMVLLPGAAAKYMAEEWDEPDFAPMHHFGHVGPGPFRTQA